MASAWRPTTEEVESVGLNLITRLLLDLAQELGWKGYLKVVDEIGRAHV